MWQSVCMCVPNVIFKISVVLMCAFVCMCHCICQCFSVRNLSSFSVLFLCIRFSLDKGLRYVGAVDFDVDFSVVLLLLLLFVERPSVADQVER